jgi:hypothetical protein
MRHPWQRWLGLGGVVPTAIAIALMTPSLQASELTIPTLSPEPPVVLRQRYRRDRQVIERTKAMVRDAEARQLAAEQGLDILNVTWEDTGRYYNSAVGPNISDLTIQMQHPDPDTGLSEVHLMPVIRHPNFADLSADIPLDRFFILVGNHRGETLRRVPLAEVLDNLRDYLHTPDSWAGEVDSLVAPERDSHVLVSAQACFLPIPRAGTATFNPVLFNYQSYPGDPAVLTLLATPEGTSITVIDNQRDSVESGGLWGQRLFFNRNGERASLTGQRLSDVMAEAGPRPGDDVAPAEDTAGLNLVMLIQVPLKQRSPWGNVGGNELMSLMTAPSVAVSESASDVEAAVIGHGPVEGPFTEIDGLEIERDPDYPIRVTVQFYKATSNGVVSEADIAEIRQQIDRVYGDGDYVGSLVVDGPSQRPTEHDGPTDEPSDWWEQFWQVWPQYRPRQP